jgi:hypothetical protein
LQADDAVPDIFNHTILTILTFLTYTDKV